MSRQVIRTASGGYVETEISTREYCRIWDLVGCPRSCWNCRRFDNGKCQVWNADVPSNYSDIIVNSCTNFEDKDGIAF